MSNKRTPSEALRCADVHIWRIGIGAQNYDEQGMIASLSPGERAKALAITHLGARQACVISHFAVRDILSRYVEMPAHDIQLSFGPFGKPQIVGSHIKYNLTHSNEWALCAVTRDDEVGVDVEKIRSVTHFDELIERFLSRAECAELRACPKDARLSRFFQIWTAREAYLKGLGVGLKFLATSFAGDDTKWIIVPLEVDRDYAASLAVHKESLAISYFDWPVIASVAKQSSFKIAPIHGLLRYARNDAPEFSRHFVIGLGSSHPCGADYLDRACERLAKLPFLKVLSESETQMGGGVGTDDALVFYNRAICVTTPLHPSALWFEMAAIESKLGRIRTKRNAPRTIDLDLLCWSGADYHDAWVTLPHPRLHERRFAIDLARQALKKIEGPNGPPIML